MSAQPEYLYRYNRPSSFSVDRQGPRLVLATCGGTAENHRFFAGRVLAPRLFAELLLTVARTARTRFHIPPAMLEKILALADPVVTSDMGHLRFEAFSGCAGAYVRADFPHSLFDGEHTGKGTTNVDFNPEMRASLATVRDHEPLNLAVGPREVEIATPNVTVTERKVKLPSRWLKAFLEVQAYQARMKKAAELSGVHVSRFFQNLPKQKVKGPMFLAPSGSSLRISHLKSPGAIPVGGLERLRLLDMAARGAQGMAIYSEASGAIAFELAFKEQASLTLVLSPDVWRGFSGEGQALEILAEGERFPGFERIKASLAWQGVIDVNETATRHALAPDLVLRGFALLASTGKVGYSLAAGSYFHRELPYDFSEVLRLNPRLLEARKLAGSGEIRITRGTGGEIEAWVPGTGVKHRVRSAEGGYRCTCPWFSRHQGQRGPCKHILAVQITEGQDE
ncbi:MAG: SWIM zinc finger family protein [Acidobacteria bacterium]|nr:SWIM zinc finger family protein [Acidobacteriota bacterium]